MRSDAKFLGRRCEKTAPSVRYRRFDSVMNMFAGHVLHPMLVGKSLQDRDAVLPVSGVVQNQRVHLRVIVLQSNECRAVA